MLRFEDEDGVDEPDAIMFTPSVDQRHHDDTEVTETHGVTMKTHTGLTHNHRLLIRP